MKTKALFVSALFFGGCGSASRELAFDAHGARTVSVDDSGYGDASPTSGWITTGEWTLSLALPKVGTSIDALHGAFTLREAGSDPFAVGHGGTCTIDVTDASSSSFTGTFSCVGLSNARGETIDVSGHFAMSGPPPSSSPPSLGNPEQGDPCKSGLPDLYCR